MGLNTFDVDLETKSSYIELSRISEEIKVPITSEKFSEYLDSQDQLSPLRHDFKIPHVKYNAKADFNLVMPDDECIYMCGNSLGLQPKRTASIACEVMDKMTGNNIFPEEEKMLESPDKETLSEMARIVGANTAEITLMNGLTVNLHLLLVSFYRPTQHRHKILIESKAFPSDHYIAESQIHYHGFDPKTSMLIMEPRSGEDTLRREDVIDLIRKEGDSIALVLFPGVQYYTGQLFDMETITKEAQKKGCYVCFDLAHAVGNVEIRLHEWGVDFAAWCTYKYLNSGPGCIGGAFVHDKHKNSEFIKFLGPEWLRKARSNLIANSSDPGVIADYQVSPPCPLLLASVKCSMEIFAKTSIKKLRNKSFYLTGLLKYLIKHHFPESNTNSDSPSVSIITPDDFKDHGAQLSLIFSVPITEIHEEMTKRGVICDVRKPYVIRVAPAPLYCKFNDVYKFVEVLRESVLAANTSFLDK